MSKISEEECKSLFLTSKYPLRTEARVSPSTYRSGSAFSYQPSISDSITSTGPVGENAANQRSAAWRDSHVSFFFCFINRVENLTGKRSQKKHEKGGRNGIKRRYVRVGWNREVETGSRRRCVLSPPLFLPFSRESQFSLQPTGHGSIDEGETSQRWTRGW